MSTSSSYQRVREHLGYLGLQAAAEHLSAELYRALREHLSPTQVLERLLDLEIEATTARRLRFAHYPVHKLLADFDFDFQPTLDRKLIAELSTLRFVEEHRNVILLGPPRGNSRSTSSDYREELRETADCVVVVVPEHVYAASTPPH